MYITLMATTFSNTKININADIAVVRLLVIFVPINLLIGDLNYINLK